MLNPELTPEQARALAQAALYLIDTQPATDDLIAGYARLQAALDAPPPPIDGIFVEDAGARTVAVVIVRGGRVVSQERVSGSTLATARRRGEIMVANMRAKGGAR